MKKFDLRRATIETKIPHEGCTVSGSDIFDNVIEQYASKEAALEALRTHHTEVREFPTPIGRMYYVAEWFVEENEYDEDGDWLEGGDIWGFTKMPFRYTKVRADGTETELTKEEAIDLVKESYRNPEEVLSGIGTIPLGYSEIIITV